MTWKTWVLSKKTSLLHRHSTFHNLPPRLPLSHARTLTTSCLQACSFSATEILTLTSLEFQEAISNLLMTYSTCLVCNKEPEPRTEASPLKDLLTSRLSATTSCSSSAVWCRQMPIALVAITWTLAQTGTQDSHNSLASPTPWPQVTTRPITCNAIWVLVLSIQSSIIKVALECKLAIPILLNRLSSPILAHNSQQLPLATSKA